MGGRRRTKGESPRCDFASAATSKNSFVAGTRREFFLLKINISVRDLCQIAMLIALAFVLERLIPIVNLPTFRITLAFIPMMCCGMLFGPVWGAVAFGVADVLGWPLMGLTPIPLILVSRIAEGFLYGLILHRDKIKLWPHAAITACATQLICGAGLTTLGLSLFLGNPYFPLLWLRLPQHILYIILQIAALPILVRLRDTLRKSGFVSA